MWAVVVPVVFALLVVALVAIFRPERKLLAGLIGLFVVGAASIVYLPLSLFLVVVLKWWVILVPVMGVAFFYVGLMYLRDAKSVHFLWAIFLGLLRTCVYVILAGVFLLPGCQHYDKHEYESVVVVIDDVSGSMFVIDDLPSEVGDPKDLLSRQDKVREFLTAKLNQKKQPRTPFLDRVVAKSPVKMYRFGDILDETETITLNMKDRKSLSPQECKEFLTPGLKPVPKPDVANLPKAQADKKLDEYDAKIRAIAGLKRATNIGGALLQLDKLENTSFVQAYIVISDGQSNSKADYAARMEFLSRVNNPKRVIPVITVGVGNFRVPTSIRIDDINAPEEARPDDRFKVRVPVVSTGLPGEPFEVTLEATRIQDALGKEVKEQTYVLPIGKGVFKGAGDQQQGTVEFEIDVQELKGLLAKEDAKGDLEGRWQFKAKVPRHKNEPFPDPHHVSDPVTVQVQKRALRVLMFAGGATREYQFLRSILYREMMEKRMEFCILNQSTGKDEHVDQDVGPERMLADFPDTLGKSDTPFMSLSDYDVIIAFDPDWTKLSKKQRENLNKWVGENAGGLIYVAGPVYTHQMARPGGQDFSKLSPLIPVVLQDNRLHTTGLGHDSSRPYPLIFNPAAKQYDFLKLQEDGESPTAGWNGFFWGNEKFNPDPRENLKPKKGFFTYYPVERLKTASEVVAVFAGPKESRISPNKDSYEFKDMQPFIVTMPFGSGKSLYLGSGEFWRLRSYKDGFHERFWIKTMRYVSAGAKEQKKYGRILMPRIASKGTIQFEAQIRGKDLLALPSDHRPTVRVRFVEKKGGAGGPAVDPKAKDPKKDAKETKEAKDNKLDDKKKNLTFDLKAKPADGEWQGYFEGQIDLDEPGEYEFILPVPTVEGEYLRQTLIVREPNPELDNVRTNFGYLYQLASPSDSMLKNLPAETKKKIEAALQVPEGQTESISAKGGKRLFFSLATADAISDCLVQVPPKSDTVKGRFEDIWARGFNTGWKIDVFWATLVAPLVVGLFGAIILLALRQWISAAGFFGLCVFVSLLSLLYSYFPLPAVGIVGVMAVLGGLSYLVYAAIKKEYFGIAVLFVVGGLAIVLAGVLYFQLPANFLENSSTALRTESLELGFSFLLVIAVSLVGLEWLTRKLLRLA